MSLIEEDHYPDQCPGGDCSEQDEKVGAKSRRIISIVSLIGAACFIGFLIVCLKEGWFSNISAIQDWIQSTGLFAPVIFVLLNVSQAFFPVIPFGATMSIGIVLFGAFPAFLCNYLSGVIADSIAFWLTRKFGGKILLLFAAPDKIKKWQNYLRTKKSFSIILFLILMLPVNPDLVLCMLAGLSGMSWKKFLTILCLAKPFSVWAYSTGLLKVFDTVLKWLHH